jgi:CubicO group peptidase (beta-lactamase class C family)
MSGVTGLWGVLAGIFITSCSLTSQAGDAFGQERIFPAKEWEEATPESQGVDSAKLREALVYLAENSGSDDVKEVVIIRNGYLIWKGDSIDKVHGVWSLTKSFTSTALGLLIDEGKCTIDALAKDYVPDMSKTYPGITLRHFTTMTSGYYAVGDEPRGGYAHGPSQTPFKPAEIPLFSPPGSRYAYWDSAMNQFGNVLSHIAGESIKELFKRKIADPIGMNPDGWNWGDFGEIDGLIVNGGSGNNGKHIFISARELARFGYLFLNRGKWDNEQLISASWVDAANTVQVPASMPLEELSGADGRGVYGYNWWVNGIKADGKRKWPDAPLGTYSASGYNNNDMFVIPEWNMVIVRLGLDQSELPITDKIYNTFLSKIGQSVRIRVPAAAIKGSADIAPGKFIPTFAIKYGGTTGWPPVEEAARFDLIDVSSSMSHARVHASEYGNTWQTLKHLNPHIKIILYKNGPALYNAASWGQMGEGWDWMTQHHGVNSLDRWAAIGVEYNGYLQGKPYPNERLMNMGNRNWQEYWMMQNYRKFWSGEGPIGIGADGIFADNTRYDMPWRGQWHSEGHPDKKDMMVDYYRDGTHQAELYKTHMKQFFDWAVPWLEKRGRILVPNFGGMSRHPEDWLELDSESHPVFAAMEEGAFVHPWGTLGRQGNFVFWNESEWLNQVKTMRNLKNVRVLMNVHGPVLSEAQDISRMDAVDASGNRAWDVLWYAMTSFLQGFDDQRQNAYMNFTVWGYSRFFWFKEFDPEYLHLGKARGELGKLEGHEGYVYAREFDDGWVVVNPTKVGALGIPVPGNGKARVLTHDTFLNAETEPLVERFDLPVHRGVILLKPDRKAGNQDNL